jgi:hypothetical protein
MPSRDPPLKRVVLPAHLTGRRISIRTILSIPIQHCRLGRGSRRFPAQAVAAQTSEATMHRLPRSLKAVGVAGIAAFFLIRLVVIAAAMPAPGPVAVQGFPEGSIVQPIDCIKYCVRKEFCTYVKGRGFTCRPCSFNSRACHCVEWATACPGGHF